MNSRHDIARHSVFSSSGSFAENIILATDSYKVSHWKQYPPETTGIFSFFESRGGKFPETVFFGLQYYLVRYLAGVRITEEHIEEARNFFAKHFGSLAFFNEEGWRYIIEKYGGRLPVVIRAVPEGSVVPTGNVLMTVESTDSKVPWVTNYLETILSQVWYPTTVATLSRAMKQMILTSLEKTGDPSLIDFKLHDFGYRGSTSVESAALGGAAHLLNFTGTDNLAGLLLLARYYRAGMPGFSIPAAEHSTITSWERDREADAYRTMLESFPNGLVAVVSDSYDVYRACEELWGRALREQVLSRDGTLIVRPDSGNPSEVVVRVLDILGEAFGYERNAKGYKVLDPHVRVIQGDGIDRHSLPRVISAIERAGWSADNLAFGSGGGLLQSVTRDTQRFAFKCSAVEVGGVWREVYKDPVTDPGKKSKAGRLKLVREKDTMKTVDEKSSPLPNLLEKVFENGEVLVEHSFDEVSERLKNTEAVLHTNKHLIN